MGAPAPIAGSTAAPGSRRWLFGPGPDLVLGCGLGYSAVLLGMCVFGSDVRTRLGMSVIPFLTLLVGAPHYGATLLRVYERREDRRAYAFFAVYATIALAAAFALGTRSLWVGSLLLTLYLTWSPWHYTGQNYGLAVMFLRRRGIAIEPSTKRLVYASFAFSFVLTFVVMHMERPAAPYAPTLYQGYQMIPLGIPSAVAETAIPVLAAGWLGCLLLSVMRLRGHASWSDLVPSALLALTQGLWFSVPVLVRHYGLLGSLDPFTPQHASYYFFFAALGHSIQYCWVTSYYARSAPGYRGLAPYLLRALLAGTAIWTVPALLFAPGLLGAIPFEAGLGALVAAVVNLHHFVLDGAIWKLRDTRIARVLIRSEASQPPGLEPARTGGLPLAPLVWAVGAVSLGIVLVAAWEQEFGVRRALERGDAARSSEAARRLAWIGRESPLLELQLANLMTSRGDSNAALRHLQRSLEIHPTPEAWLASADLYERAGALDAADAALARALALRPEQPGLAYRAGQLALRRGDTTRARELLEQAVALEPDRKLYRLALERVGVREATATP
jgi:hypothetical protein